MASPAFSFCAAVENSVQMLFIEIETDPYTATRLAGNDLEICKLTYGTRKELFQIRLRDIPDLLAVIINADGGISLVVVCIIGEIIELAVLLDFAENFSRSARSASRRADSAACSASRAFFNWLRLIARYIHTQIPTG